MDLTTRVSLVQNLLTTKEIPASVGAKLLDINRTSIYYKTSPVSDEELACKEIIDHLHTDNPTWGARQMSAQLKNRGYHVGRRKARRYMNEMDIYPIYPKIMDGKSRWADNIMIERWFRSFKYEEAYLTLYNNIKDARVAIGRYVHTYNFERCHSALDYKTPAECYYPAMLLPYAA